jgi:predicted ATPase/DNA-binding CsgD family transcriptional regulator
VPLERPAAQESPDLPVYASRFIGRQREVAELTAHLAQARLITLVGAAGSGKTRLAIELSRQTDASWPDGVCVVELAALTEARSLPEAFASAMHLPEDGSRPLTDVLIERLTSFRGLILVDNCEHLIEACAELVDRILRRCPTVTMLATSREALRVDGESVWPVPTLACPREGASLYEVGRSEAVQLFVARAQAAAPRFEVNGSNAKDVAAICRRLDGLPLAIELAAPRVAVLDPESITAQLEDRFRFLTDGFRTAPARQRTLRAAIDWSYDLLTSAEQQMFERLSVFAGGFDLKAAQKVCSGGSVLEDQVLHVLGRLIAKSLVQPTGSGRYRLLESLRAYGLDRLRDAGRLETWRLRHAQHFASLAYAALEGRQSPTLMQISPEEVDNLREALAWSRSGDRRLHLQLAIAFGWFCCRAGYAGEGRTWLEPALTGDGDIDAHTALGCRILSILAWRQNEAEAAEGFAADELRLSRAQGDERMLAGAWGNLAHVRLEFGRFADAAAAVREETAIAERVGDAGLRAEALFHLGFLEAQQSHFIAARDHLWASARLHEEALRDSTYLNMILGWVFLGLKEVEPARSAVNKVTLARWRSRDIGFLPAPFEASAEIAFLDGAPERAMRLIGAADFIRERNGIRVSPMSLASRGRWIARAERVLGKEARSAWLQGKGWTVEEMVAYALAPPDQAPPRAGDLGGSRLSRREIQIAELVARGLSNEEVARQLNLSRRTVDAHLEHIRTKLGVRSRVGVATWITDRAQSSL